MNGDTLAAAMPGLDPARAAELAAPANAAMLHGQITTRNRAAMFLAQIGEESVSLRYTEEIASGWEYEGRTDLGNIYPGDGPRYKGRSFIQVTGRSNYGAFSRWAQSVGLVPSSTYFVDNPELVATPAWAWYGPIWYWTVARPTLNSYADSGNVDECTRLINGGYHGLQDRTDRWFNCLSLGDAILPVPPPNFPPPPPSPVPQPQPQEVPDMVLVYTDTGKGPAAWIGEKPRLINSNEWRAVWHLQKIGGCKILKVSQPDYDGLVHGK